MRLQNACLARPKLMLLVIVSFVMPLLFAGFTGHVWEDFYITFRSSKNLVEGHGLVFQPGEHVHTFTSPLGTLLPAACSWIVGTQNDRWAIWLFRVVNSAFLAAALLLVVRVALRLKCSTWGMTALVLLFIFDPKITDFTINGMETGMLLFFFAWTIDAVAEFEGRVWCLAIGLAGLMWTRPDAFVFAGSLLAGFWVFVWAPRPQSEQWPVWRWLLFASGIGAVIYLPWIFWTWSYYGSPVPNTIIAKSALASKGMLQSLISYPFQLLGGSAQVLKLFVPSYHFMGGWHESVSALSGIIALPTVLYFAWPKAEARTRALSLALFLGGAYLEAVPMNYPWYQQVWQMLAILVLALMLSEIFRGIESLRSVNSTVAERYSWLVKGAVVATISGQLALYGCVAVQCRTNQTQIENGGRRQIGEWLRTNARPTDTILLEPLGYVGYFSRLKTLDYPGLSAPEVTRAIKNGATTWPALVGKFQPDWLLVRPSELNTILAQANNKFGEEYSLTLTFDARKQIESQKFLPGRNYPMYDAVFYLFRRTAPHTIGN